MLLDSNDSTRDASVPRWFVVTKLHSKQKDVPVDIDIKLGTGKRKKCYKNFGHGENCHNAQTCTPLRTAC